MEMVEVSAQGTDVQSVHMRFDGKNCFRNEKSKSQTSRTPPMRIGKLSKTFQGTG